MKSRAALAFLLPGLAISGLYAACPMHPDAPPELAANHDCCRLAQADWDAALAKLQIQPSDHSLYQVESLWENQKGDAAPLSQLAGRPQLIAMAYTTCQFACPRLLADLKAIEAQLEASGDSLPGFTLVTFDPERDTPEQFRRYADDNQLDLQRWTLLRSQPGDILELANLLGVRYQKLPNGEFSHSNIITLLNEEGEVVGQAQGLGADATSLLKALQALSE